MRSNGIIEIQLATVWLEDGMHGLLMYWQS
jgi:hypothetical protein